MSIKATNSDYYNLMRLIYGNDIDNINEERMCDIVDNKLEIKYAGANKTNTKIKYDSLADELEIIISTKKEKIFSIKGFKKYNMKKTEVEIFDGIISLQLHENEDLKITIL